MVVAFTLGAITETGVGIVMLRPAVAFSGVPSESMTWTTKLAVPGSVGVPEIVPVLASRDNPAGRLPEARIHVYGATPPVAANTVE
jgi:hypothetical protein